MLKHQFLALHRVSFRIEIQGCPTSKFRDCKMILVSIMFRDDESCKLVEALEI